MSDTAPDPAPTEVTVVKSNPNSNLAMFGFALVAFLGVLVVALFLKGNRPPVEDPEITRLRAENAQLASGGTATNTGNTVATLIQRVDTDVDTIKGMLTSMNAEMANLQSEVTSSRNTISFLTQDNTRLQNELAKSSSNAAEVETLKSQLENARTLLASSNEQLAVLRDKPDNSAALLAAQRSIEALKQQVADLEKQVASADSLRAEIQRLRAELDRSRLYVEDSANLAPAAAALFVELQQLEGSTPEALRTAYERIGQSVNARRVDLVAFQTGSSNVDTGRYGRITKDIVGASDNSFFLVVGYASKSGDSTSNRSLSAKRATTVASIVNASKRPGQKIQAVYLGETDRFSPTSEAKNQICEIWEITRQN